MLSAREEKYKVKPPFPFLLLHFWFTSFYRPLKPGVHEKRVVKLKWSHGHQLIFIEALLWLRYDHEEMFCFVPPGSSPWKYLLTWSTSMTYTFTTPITCRKNSQTICSPEKNMCNLKNFLPQEFQWSLTLFTTRKKSYIFKQTIFAKSSILDVWQSSKYVSAAVTTL